MNLGTARRTAAFVAEWTPRLETREARQARERLDEACASILETASWAVGRDPDLAAAILTDGATYWVARGHTGDAIALAQRLLDVLPDPAASRARVLATLARLLGVRGDPEARAYAAEALDLGEALGLRDVAIEALYELADPGEIVGVPVEQVEAALARVGAWDPRSVREQAILLDLEATVARRTKGLHAEAEVFARGLAAARRDGLLRRMVHLGGNLSDLHLALGRTEAAGSTAAEAATDAREIGDARNEARSLGVLALVLVLGGDTTRASRALKRAVLLAAAVDAPPTVGHVLASAAGIAAIGGNPGDAAWLEGAASTVYPEPAGSSSATHEHPGLRRGFSRARARLGRSAWARQAAAGAAAPRSEALARAEGVADGLGGSPAAPAAVGLGLSQREIEVLTLLGEGLSDAAIGAGLYISPKTVSVHLNRAKAKTGARTRVDLAMLARQLLVDQSAA